MIGAMVTMMTSQTRSEGHEGERLRIRDQCRLQALVYDSLPPATAISDYAISMKQNEAQSARAQSTNKYSRRLRSLLLYLCYVFRARINSLVLLITPRVSENCQLSNSFSLVLEGQLVCNRQLTDNSDYIRRFFYHHPRCLNQSK